MITPTLKELVNALQGLQLEMAFNHDRFKDVVLYCTHEEWMLSFENEPPLWGALESYAQLAIEDDTKDMTLTAEVLLSTIEEYANEFTN